MSIEIKVPVLPESVSDAVIATWHKQPGEQVSRDENLVDIETDKVVLEVVAPDNGCLEKIIKQQGANVGAQEVIALFTKGDSKTEAAQSDSIAQPQIAEKTESVVQAEPVAKPEQVATSLSAEPALSPAARRRAASGEKIVSVPVSSSVSADNRNEKRVPMTRLRAKIAERLLQAQQNSAILTTFNEVNVQAIKDARAHFGEKFAKEHGVKLGFMSFFVVACLEALKKFPMINASIDGNDIVYHGFYDIGIAVGSKRGLVVPVLRNVDTLTMAEIEKQIKSFGKRAEEGQLTIEEMTGGTFTISNGGVYGSLLSTPILNPPQSAILGMHKIQDRVVVEDGQMVTKPMMYLALSYDHRLIDGAESVRFLLTIKEALEDPTKILLGV